MNLFIHQVFYAVSNVIKHQDYNSFDLAVFFQLIDETLSSKLKQTVQKKQNYIVVL